jgi:hypothetical protein
MWTIGTTIKDEFYNIAGIGIMIVSFILPLIEKTIRNLTKNNADNDRRTNTNRPDENHPTTDSEFGQTPRNNNQPDERRE